MVHGCGTMMGWNRWGVGVKKGDRGGTERRKRGRITQLPIPNAPNCCHNKKVKRISAGSSAAEEGSPERHFSIVNSAPNRGRYSQARIAFEMARRLRPEPR